MVHVLPVGSIAEVKDNALHWEAVPVEESSIELLPDGALFRCRHCGWNHAQFGLGALMPGLVIPCFCDSTVLNIWLAGHARTDHRAEVSLAELRFRIAGGEFSFFYHCCGRAILPTTILTDTSGMGAAVCCHCAKVKVYLCIETTVEYLPPPPDTWPPPEEPDA